ncbi:hypothetical protein FLAN108750_10670 [Flavobacterium antarcticum]|uniref:hypothetical protein n=1 Tax=Flavobacterium antarcticum TaxID=271155 RepID=UPI0003B77B1A|nr:hypothetical protein [Flavobacterium antarcticum]
MKRRDSERIHPYSNTLFRELGIFDLQGVLKKDSLYQCGVENYQVNKISEIDFGILQNEVEIARYYFCQHLQIPYYTIISVVEKQCFKIFNTFLIESKIIFQEECQLTISEFIVWWRDRQPYTQTKPMYDAADRIKNSMIDCVLFENKLAWGVNIDGFSFKENQHVVNAIYEKRICTCKTAYNVSNYDPNKYFFGTTERKGDFPSWNVLGNLARTLSCRLFLLTFDTSDHSQVGVTRITNISKENGLTYLNDAKPYHTIFENNSEELKLWMHARM